MPGSIESLETRLRSLTAASAAAKAVKRAHRAAALAVQSAAPPRPRSQYFSRNRNQPGTTNGPGARGTDGDSDGDGEDDLIDVDARGAGGDDKAAAGRREGQQGPAAGPKAGGAAAGGARAARFSEDSDSSVSRSITSSGVSSDYTTGDGSSDDDSDDSDDEEDAGSRAKAAGSALNSTASERQRAPSRLGVVTAAMEAVAQARAQLRQPPAAPGLRHGLGHPSVPVLSPTSSAPVGAGNVVDTPRLPPVVPRSRGGSHDSGALDVGPHGSEGRRAEAAAPAPAGGLSALLSLPSGAQASRRSALLASGPSNGSGGGIVGLGSAASSSSGTSLGSAAGGDKGERLANWVAQRFRSASRTAIQGMGSAAEAAAAPLTPAPSVRVLPGAAGSGGGEACGGLRALLTTRSDGAASWVARPARWHDPLSPVGSLHTSVLDARLSAHPSATQAAPPPPLAPLDGRAQAHPPGLQAAPGNGSAARGSREHRRGSNG